MPQGDNLEEVAAINDGVTALDSVWSGSKTAAEITAAVGAQQTTPAPQFASMALSGNDGTTQDITIQNYGASNLYTLTSSDEAFVTLSRSGSTVTVTLVDVDGAWSGPAETSRAVTFTITSYDSANYSFAGETTVTVTVHRVTVVDAAIQVTDFTAKLASSTGVTIEGSKVVATAPAAVAQSIVYEQQPGEEAWSKATPSLTLKAKQVTDLVGGVDPANLKMFTDDAALLTATAIGLVDDDNTVKSYTAALTPAPTISGTLTPNWSTSAANVPAYLTAEDAGGAPLSICKSSNGRYACVYWRDSSSYQYRWMLVELDVPHSHLGGGTKISERNLSAATLPAATQSVQFAAFGGPFTISNDGTKLYTRQANQSHGSYAWLIEYTMTTPLDLSTLSTGFSIVQPAFSTSYDEDDYGAQLYLAKNETQILITPGENYDTVGYIYCLTMNAALDLGSGHVRTTEASTSSYVWTSIEVSPDEAHVILAQKFDDNGNNYRFFRYQVSTSGDFTTFNNVPATALSVPATTAVPWCFVYDPVLNKAAAYHPFYPASSAWGVDVGADLAGDYLFNPPSSLTLTGPAISGTVDAITQHDGSGVELRLDVSADPAAPDLSGPALTINTDTGWGWNGTDIIRAIDFAELNVAGDRLAYEVAGMAIGTIVDIASIDLVRG